MNKILSPLSLILIIVSIWYSFYSSTSHQISDLNTSKQEFSTLRALEHVKNITKQPHYLGSSGHKEVKTYLIEELKKLGLTATVQEGFSVHEHGELSKPQNIVARIKGTTNGKTLLLLTHYDSHPHSSYGASDAGSGVATILEGLRAYLSQNTTPKNDIIICFSDGEELGLNGANLFVAEHPWAKDVGLALNFEARGSGGNSFMLMETNGKNGKMIEEFIKANPEYPVTNSLAYSIYKKLPNDTDLTVFREHGAIDGYNFAFIDDHYDYHSANDTWQNLDLKSLQHQGSYLMPLLQHFSNADITNLKSEDDYLYFNIPILKMIKYPFILIYPLLGIAFILFIILIRYGKIKRRINFQEIGTGFFALLISLGLAGGLAFGLWNVLTVIYPHYNEILQGFPYNGHLYIFAVALLAIAASSKVYSIFDSSEDLPSLLIAPLFFWLLISGAAAFYLPGASYFIILVYLQLICMLLLILHKKPFLLLLLVFCLPSIFIIAPFIASFPVALGLKTVFVSAILVVLLFSLLLPVIGFYAKKGLIGNLAFLGSVICLVLAHFYSDFNEDRPKPNSLVYMINQDQNKAYWASYDQVLDPWTKKYIDPSINKVKKLDQDTLHSKYNNLFTYINEAPIQEFKSSLLEVSFDSIYGNTRILDICLRPQRALNRIDLYMDSSFNFESLHVNGATPKEETTAEGKAHHIFTNRVNSRLLTYFINDNEPLELRMKFHKDSVPELTLYESSYDLLENKELAIPKRNVAMIPKPFVLNDAIIIKKSFSLAYVEKEEDTTKVENTVEETLINEE